MKIKEIEKELRPRERLINNGAYNLTDSELLAIILSSGSKNESAIDLAKRLVKEFGLKRLFDMNYDELKKINGIKEAKATKLMAIFEVTRRLLKIEDNSIILAKPIDVYNYVKNDYLFINYEMITIIYVNKLSKVIAKKNYNEGLVNRAFIPFRKIIYDAINLNAYGIIMIHNHPSGDIRPSEDDLYATKLMIDTLKPLNIILFDHLVISNSKYYSIGENKVFNK